MTPPACVGGLAPAPPSREPCHRYSAAGGFARNSAVLRAFSRTHGQPPFQAVAAHPTPMSRPPLRPPAPPRHWAGYPHSHETEIGTGPPSRCECYGTRGVVSPRHPVTSAMPGRGSSRTLGAAQCAHLGVVVRVAVVNDETTTVLRARLRPPPGHARRAWGCLGNCQHRMWSGHRGTPPA